MRCSTYELTLVQVDLLPLCYGNQVMLDLGLRQRPEEGRWKTTQLKKHSTRNVESLALISRTLHFYLNLGLSLVTTPTSNSVGLKSMFRTEDRHDIANWRKTSQESLSVSADASEDDKDPELEG